MKNVLNVLVVFFMVSVLTISCNKDNNEAPTKGFLKGTVKSSTNEALSNVRIIVYDANTNSPTGNAVVTGTDGSYKVELAPGTYYLNLTKQGYEGVPSAGITPVSVTVELGKETVSDFLIQKSSVVNGGSISGKVTDGSKALAGVMVIAVNGTSGYSSVTGTDGSYVIYNIPAGSYQVQGLLANYNGAAIAADVTANTESSGKNITMAIGATGSVTGSIGFAATNNGEVDVTLTHPITRQTIPGLVTKTSDGNYTISKVPDGTYIARATFANDGYVVDPDWIVKNGEPTVTVSGNAITQDFSVTGAIRLVSPTNDSTSTKPVEITGTTPTFTWVAYSSTSDYVIEVSDINGNVIWGGFTKTNTAITKNISIPKSQVSVVFNSDGKAKSALKTNTIYRWRVYSSKDDNSVASGWKLISVSEEQRGLFVVK